MNKLEIIASRIYDHEKMLSQRSIWSFKERTVVFTNGCFDILHLGHIEYLAKAAELGDELVIGLNSDSSVKKIKGPHRPITDERSRAMILASLTFVTAVIIFDEDTPYELISRLKPDILVKGEDYRKDEIVGHDIVESYGGKVVRIELTPGYSTTAIEQKILQLQK